MNLDRYTKAVVTAVGVAYGLYVAATNADSAGHVAVTRDEWVGIVVTTVLTTFAVWAAPNTPDRNAGSGSAPDSVTTVNVDRAPVVPVVPAAYPGSTERKVYPS